MAEVVRIDDPKARKREQNRAYYLANRERLAEKARERAAQDREGRREASRRWREANPEKVREKSRRWSAANADRRWAANLMRLFGITSEDYAAMLEAQGGVCAACSSPPTAQRLAVDHCHATGRIRGLLCRDCNLGVGHFRDDPERLRAAADHLERS